MDSQHLPGPGWWVASLGACATGITWFFSHFATTKELKELKADVKDHLIQYQKDRLMNEKIYQWFVDNGRIK